MPNHCANQMIVAGPPEALAAFAEGRWLDGVDRGPG